MTIVVGCVFCRGSTLKEPARSSERAVLLLLKLPAGRGIVLDCGSPLPLSSTVGLPLDNFNALVFGARPTPKRQGAGAVQNLAAVRPVPNEVRAFRRK
jgi:hypothetical protein